MRPPIPLLVLSCLLPASCADASPGDPAPSASAAPSDAGPVPVAATARVPFPRPTEHLLDKSAENDNTSRRKAWFAERHRAAPGVSYQKIERRNGHAQKRKRNTLATMSAVPALWRERGSRNQAGRMHVATRSPDGSALYGGSALGGIWRGAPDGTGWEPLGDNVYGGAHWLVVVSGAQPGDPPVMVRATDGGAIDTSTDDGATWQTPPGLGSVNAVRRLLATSDGSETIFLVARRPEGVLGQNAHGLWRSTDRGATFQKVYDMGGWGGDAWVPRDGGAGVWLLHANTLRVSTDGGDTFSLAGTIGATASGGRLAGSEAGGPTFYAILAEGGGYALHRSADGGASWTYQREVTDYWGSLAASLVDEDLFAWGGVEVWRSTDGGATVEKVNDWWAYYDDVENQLHADVPGLDVCDDGGGQETWYVSTDGGLFESKDGLQTVANLSLDGLRVSQYYSTHTSTADPAHVVAGSQDQGYQRAGQPAAPTDLLDFDQLISGDYGHLTSTDGSHEYLYCTYPGFVLIQRDEDAPVLYTADFPDGETNAWLPPVVADPDDPTSFFFCASRLYRYENAFVTQWTPTLYSTFDFGQSPGEYVSGLTFSPVDADRAWAVTSTGRLFHSSDQGLTWTPSATTGPAGQYFYGTAILASRTDADTVWVAGSGYSGPSVWRSTDGGATFAPFDDGLPPTLVYALAEDPDEPGTLFCGTETAAYRRAAGAGSWVDITLNDAPVTIYWSVEAVESEAVMRFGTYGRGIWDYDLTDGCGYAAYGVGLGGNNVMTLDTTSSTAVGTTHELTVSGGLPNRSATLLFSPFQAELPLFGGTLLVDPGLLVQIPFDLSAFGGATIPLAVPDVPAFVGVPVSFQAAHENPPLIGGWSFSNGLAGVLCESGG